MRNLGSARAVHRVYTRFRVSFLILRSVLGTSRPAGVRRRSGCVILVLGLFCPGARGRRGRLSRLLRRRIYIVLKDGCILAFLRRRASFFSSVGTTLHGSMLGVHDHRASCLLDMLLGDVVAGCVSAVSSVSSTLRSLRRRLLAVASRGSVNVRVRSLQHRCVLVGGSVLPLGRRCMGLLQTRGLLVRGMGHTFFGSIGSRLRFILRAVRVYHRALSSLISLCVSGGSLHVGSVVGHLAVMSAVFVPLAFLIKM